MNEEDFKALLEREYAKHIEAIHQSKMPHGISPRRLH